jgi:hypothetical protein
MQNPQFSFQIYDDAVDITNILLNIRNLKAQMFVPISPNVNWKNNSHWLRTKSLFRSLSPHTHISATSSDIGLDINYFHKQLVGGTTIITSGIWATKVSSYYGDKSGFGSYSVTTLQGKNKRKISFIAAYIAVRKGTNIGVESMFAQQTTIYEHQCMLHNRIPKKKICPRKNAIQRLDELIMSLQQEKHATVLMVDANQTSSECLSSSETKPYSIEWLKSRRCLIDPFISLCGSRPNSTTQTPNRDKDFVLTYGISVSAISTLGINNPAMSDHLGICFDINLETFFQGQYSDLPISQPRGLSSGHSPSISSYIKYVNEQIDSHELWTRVKEIHNTALNNPAVFPENLMREMNKIDSQLTEILLAGEHQCSK